jgi:hypothetical protein
MIDQDCVAFIVIFYIPHVFHYLRIIPLFHIQRDRDRILVGFTAILLKLQPSHGQFPFSSLSILSVSKISPIQCCVDGSLSCSPIQLHINQDVLLVYVSYLNPTDQKTELFQNHLILGLEASKVVLNKPSLQG